MSIITCNDAPTWAHEDRVNGDELVRVYILRRGQTDVAYVWKGLWGNWFAYVERTCSDIWKNHWRSLESAQAGVERIVATLEAT